MYSILGIPTQVRLDFLFGAVIRFKRSPNRPVD